MADFTFAVYKNLLKKLLSKGYLIESFESFVSSPEQKGKRIVLRHDVDRHSRNAIKMAEIEYNLGIKSTYYFRIAPKVFVNEVVSKIVELGHEIGYHYEDMDLAKGDIDKAYQLFEIHLNHVREFYPVKTICMHGSPMSKWDNRSIWEKYEYKKLDIIAEPYLDVDYNKVLYLTDTGRKWNNANVSVRDKVASSFSYTFKNTLSIIQMIETDSLPDHIIINIHPHRWFNHRLFWLKELLIQSIKNQIKSLVIRKKEHRQFNE